MLRSFCMLIACCAFTILSTPTPCMSADNRTLLPIQEEVWALPLIHPTVAYVVRPVGPGPFPLAVMNHGVSLNSRERSFFPLVEFRDAAMWFARRGYLVVAPTGPGYGAAALDTPERGLFAVFYSKIGACENPNFGDAGMAAALLDKWIIDYMTDEKLAVPNSAIVIGQSAGGWAAIALSSQNLASVKALIVFAGGRGGRVDGKPNNNCAPDKLVEATAGFGRSARTPMLWIYIENDTFFGPDLSKRMHAAYTGAGGSAEYHLMPPFGNEGHFFIGSPDAIPQWSPLVSRFLDKHRPRDGGG
jgi:dienelactone hydrolase